MKLIVITKPDFFPDEAERITALFEAGLEILHLRKPHSECCEVERLLNEIPKCYHTRIVLHDHFELATRYAVRGVHLNRRNSLPPEGFVGTVSRSCHSLAEVERYKAECVYLFLSPIYDSISKEGYGTAFSADTLREAHERGIIDEKVMALGGVTSEHFGEIVELGFGGAVVLGDVWQQTAENFIPHFARLLCLADKTFGKNSIPPVVLTVAGSDSSGGAGIQADIKTISALGGYAASVITAVTAQNTLGVTAIQAIPPKIIEQQIVAVMDDLHVDAVKIGMLYDVATVASVVTALKRYQPRHVVCDPVMVATSGSRLMENDVATFMKEQLFPLCTLITPNLYEAEALLGCKIEGVEQMREAARKLADDCHTAVLVKGGHLSGKSMCDILYDGREFYEFAAEYIESRNLHGTGCTLSSAIATCLARGLSLSDAVAVAKRYVTRAISLAQEMNVGHGNGPLWHRG